MAFILLTLAIAEPAAFAMELTCIGQGAVARTHQDSISLTGDYGGSASGTIDRREIHSFEEQVDVHVGDGDSRIRLPRVMLPILHGGEGGWFKLKGVNIGPEAITGSATINPINNPKIYIDRRTGVISINGKSGRFTGQCERRSQAAQERRF